MSKEVIDGGRIDVKIKKRYPAFEFDRLQMYFGQPYVIDLESAKGKVIVLIPTIGDLVEVGEKDFYATLNIFITNTTAYRLMLHEINLDWNVVTDFELFCMLYQKIDQNVANLLFDHIDFSKFELSTKQTIGSDEKTIVLYDKENDIEINEEVYQHIAQFLRMVFNMQPEEKITDDPMLKEMYLHKDRRQLEIEKTKKQKTDNSMLPLISACVNHPGFKYKLLELRHVNVCEFYDSVKRLQIYENTTALLRGSYSGMIDSSKIDKEQFNFMREA